MKNTATNTDIDNSSTKILCGFTQQRTICMLKYLNFLSLVLNLKKAQILYKKCLSIVWFL